MIDGYLQDDTARHELIALPYASEDAACLNLVFADGSTLEVCGTHPQIRLEGRKVFLQDYF